ncbi:STAS domain-containing protein [Salipaludibacillus daqingensis]|uniref:STAS domain-containing protein n=1 Tax=Salipaludibacillus daqingensis TaxID=3041001 RepID=UPI002475CB62|nr:STAS domain-containing protein [Salipaludibacillus daqingensis]
MEHQLPLPLFNITDDFHIISRSMQAEEIFPLTENLLEIVDQDNVDKMKNCFITSNKKIEFEINLITNDSPLELFRAFATINGTKISCVFVPMGDQYDAVQKQLGELQDRLNDTNFELFQKKEKYARIVDQFNELSGPYIQLSEDLALLPVFGDLTERKILAIKDSAFKRVYRNQPERVLIDFTAVGNIEREGVRELKDMILVMEQMGIYVVMIGLSPQHAQALKPYRNELHLDFVHSAKVAIQKWLIEELR